jgi:fluoroacetyl-CoA thioesterase
MRSTLEPGLTGSFSFDVTPEMAPAHLPVQVLSTPDMVRLIESACLLVAQEHLDDGETTVGTHICVSHAAAVDVGETVEVSCELTERDRRRLTFGVKVGHGDELVSEGTHQRFVVGG